MRSTAPTRAVATLFGCVLLLTSVACGGEGREYAVPETVCGVSMREDVVAPLLPEGGELREGGASLPETRDDCWLGVDDEDVLVLTFSPVEDFHDPMGDDAEWKLADRSEIEDLPFRGAGALGDSSAMITAECGGTGPPHLVVDVEVPEDVTPDVAQRRADVRDFSTDYVAGALRELGCDT